MCYSHIITMITEENVYNFQRICEYVVHVLIDVAHVFIYTYVGVLLVHVTSGNFIKFIRILQKKYYSVKNV